METTTETKVQRTSLPAHADISAFVWTEHGREAIGGVRLDKGLVEATNGKILARVQVEPEPDCEPVTATIPLEPFKSAMKLARKVPLTVEQNGHLELKTPSQAITATAIDGIWPNTEQVWPKDPVTHEITLSGDLLKVVSDYARKHGGDDAPIRFAFRFETDTETGKPVHYCAVEFSVRVKNGANSSETRGLIMPMRTT